MRKYLLLLLCLSAISYAIVNKDLTRIQFAIPNDKDNRTQTINRSATTPTTPTSNEDSRMPWREEVIGYTTYDWQYSGPVYSHCRVDPANGVHCYWMYSNFNPATDRNQRYNFYDFSTRTWNWTEGEQSFAIRSGFGGMDIDPLTGCYVASTHQTIGGVLTPVVAQDIAPGAGIEAYCQGPSGYRWPAVAVTQNQAIHIAMIDTTSQYSLWYSRIQPWGTWSTPISILPSPMYPSHNIAASKISNKVIILWVEMLPDSAYHNAYYKLSNDGGITWEPTVQLTFPPAFSGIVGAAPSFNLASLFACFDNNDIFHIVASVNAVFYDSFAEITPAEIWHYCPVNNPAWSFIFRYNPFGLPQYVGYNAIIADRPSIIQDPTTSYFYVTWEVFDSLNYEPLTTLARADIWVAELRNNGQFESFRDRLTSPNTTSKRFPCIGGIKDDTIFIQYMIDSIAGFENMTQGRATRNPVVVLRRYRNEYSIEEEFAKEKYYNFALLTATPNPFTSHTTIRYSLPAKSRVSLSIFDASGRLVKTLVDELKTSGVYTATWNGKYNNGIEVKSSIYFYSLKTAAKLISGKIIKTK
jgi:hypothetical protein